MALHFQYNKPVRRADANNAIRKSVVAADIDTDPANVSAINTSAINTHRERLLAKLVYSPNGLLVVQSDAGHWVVPPTTALHLLPGTEYTVRKAEHVVARTLELPALLSQHLWADNCLYRLTPLLRELLESMHASADSHAESDTKALFLIDQLTEAGLWHDASTHRCWSVPKDPRVAHICDYIYHNLDADKTLKEWAAELKNDTRTLHRLFVQEFGMPFVQWRQQMRLMAALEWLAEGRQVMDVALDLGYQTQSAFAAMFRRNMGITPSDWQERRKPYRPRTFYTADRGVRGRSQNP